MTNHPLHFIDLCAFESLNDEQKSQEIALQCDRALQQCGFLVIVNHNVASTEELKSLINTISKFFQLPIDEKAKYEGIDKNNPYGYIRTGGETLAASRGDSDAPFDLKELFQSGPQQTPPLSNCAELQKIDAFLYQQTLLPSKPPDFSKAWNRYRSLMTCLSRRIMRLFSMALGKEPEYIEKECFSGGYPLDVLRVNYYPATDPFAIHTKLQLRAGAHSDYGFITILWPEPGSRGLEVMNAQTGKWEEFLIDSKIEDAFVINIGDLMQKWTSKRWKSTLHRVVDPFYQYFEGNLNLCKPTPRVSMAFFLQPDANQLITPLRASNSDTIFVEDEAPIYSGQHLMNKFTESTQFSSESKFIT